MRRKEKKRFQEKRAGEGMKRREKKWIREEEGLTTGKWGTGKKSKQKKQNKE